jgi:hypothetical protein
MIQQYCYKVVSSLIQSWYNKNVTRLTTQGCNNIVISWLYRTCWNNLATSLIISTRLLQIVNSFFQTCWQLGTSNANTTCWPLVGRLATRCDIFAYKKSNYKPFCHIVYETSVDIESENAVDAQEMHLVLFLWADFLRVLGSTCRGSGGIRGESGWKHDHRGCDPRCRHTHADCRCEHTRGAVMTK